VDKFGRRPEPTKCAAKVFSDPKILENEMCKGGGSSLAVDGNDLIRRIAAARLAGNSNGPAPGAVAIGAWPSGKTGDTVLMKYSDGSYETRVGGDPNWRDNNPGNMRPTPMSPARGAIGVNDKTPKGPFVIFPNEPAGFQAMVDALKTPGYQAKTLGEAIQAWAPPKENDTRAYQGFVSRMLGTPLTTPMSRLDAQQIDSLARVIQRYEGSRIGTSMFWPGPY
jgi:hypothetical protein